MSPQAQGPDLWSFYIKEVTDPRLGTHRSYPPHLLTPAQLFPLRNFQGSSAGNCSSLRAERPCCHGSHWVGVP